MNSVLEPDALAILETIFDARGLVVFHELDQVRHLDDYEQERLGDLLLPLLEEMDRIRPANGILNIVKINPSGRNYVIKARGERDSPAFRATACRTALVAWTPDVSAEAAGELVSAFVGHPTAHIHGSAFTSTEISNAAEYLAERRLVIATRPLTGMIIRLHHRGRTVLENWGGDIAMWERNPGGAGGGDTTIYVEQGAQVANLVGRDNHGDMTGTVKVSTGLNTQDVADWLKLVTAMLPAAQIDSEQLGRIEDAVAELQAEVGRPAPRESILRAFGRALVEEIAKGAASITLPLLVPAVMGIIEAGQALF